MPETGEQKMAKYLNKKFIGLQKLEADIIGHSSL